MPEERKHEQGRHEQGRHGLLEEVDGGWRLRFTRRLPHRPEKVWLALTEPEHLAAWFPTTVDGERKPGAALRFTFPHGEAPAFDGEMTVYEPPSVLEYRWGPDTLRFELRDDGDGCVLTLLDTLEAKGKAARDGAGWHVCLDLLGHQLAGEQPGDAGERWKPLHDWYVADFGPDAATIGPPEAQA